MKNRKNRMKLRKNQIRIMAWLLSISLLFALHISAFAAETEPDASSENFEESEEVIFGEGYLASDGEEDDEEYSEEEDDEDFEDDEEEDFDEDDEELNEDDEDLDEDDEEYSDEEDDEDLDDEEDYDENEDDEDFDEDEDDEDLDEDFDEDEDDEDPDEDDVDLDDEDYDADEDDEDTDEDDEDFDDEEEDESEEYDPVADAEAVTAEGAVTASSVPKEITSAPQGAAVNEDETADQEQSSDIIQTSDNSNIRTWGILLLIAAAGLLATIRVWKGRSQKA